MPTVRSVVEHYGLDAADQYQRAGLHDCVHYINSCHLAQHVFDFIEWANKHGGQPADQSVATLDGPRDHRLKPTSERDFPCCDRRADDDLSGWDQDYRRVEVIDGLDTSRFPIDRVILLGLPPGAAIASRVNRRDSGDTRYVLIDVTWPGADG